MEEWQKAHIHRNLDTLIEKTACSVTLLAGLVAKEILHSDEKEEIVRLFFKLAAHFLQLGLGHAKCNAQLAIEILSE